MGKGDFAKDCLKAHNDYRKQHGAPKLKLSSDLSKHAQKWAEHLVEAGSLSHNEALFKGERLGENVAMKWSSASAEYTGDEVVKQWYSEVKDHDFSAANPSIKTGHFSQVVWKSSAELGVGLAKKDGRCVVVANYKPAGNFFGHYKDNVSPAKKTAGAAADSSGSGSGSGSDSEGSGGGKGAKLCIGKKKGDSAAEKHSAVTVAGQSERVQTSTTTSTSSTGVVKKTTVITRTITFPDGSVKTVTEEKTEENAGGAADVAGAKARFSELKLGSAARPDSALKSVAHKAESPQQFAENALRCHNVHRKKHGADPLTLAKDLTEYAQKWAEHLARTGALQHSEAKLKGETLGENVASKWGSAGADYTGEEVTEQWYSEQSKYDYSGKSNAGASGHFTQVVWKGSRELGIGKASNSKGEVFVVASYRPAGNYLGQFKENVSRP